MTSHRRAEGQRSCCRTTRAVPQRSELPAALRCIRHYPSAELEFKLYAQNTSGGGIYQRANGGYLPDCSGVYWTMAIPFGYDHLQRSVAHLTLVLPSVSASFTKTSRRTPAHRGAGRYWLVGFTAGNGHRHGVPKTIRTSTSSRCRRYRAERWYGHIRGRPSSAATSLNPRPVATASWRCRNAIQRSVQKRRQPSPLPDGEVLSDAHLSGAAANLTSAQTQNLSEAGRQLRPFFIN